MTRKPPNESVPAELRKLGVTYRQMDWWCKRGYLRPVHAGGSGNPREWSVEELAVAVQMAHLVKIGFRPDSAAAQARQSGTDAVQPAAEESA